MTIDEMIRSLQAVRSKYGNKSIGVSIEGQITLSVTVTAPPVTLETREGVKDVVVLAVIRNGE